MAASAFLSVNRPIRFTPTSNYRSTVNTVWTRATVLGLALLAAAPTIALAAPEPELPPLPVIALETFPQDARTALEAALVEARRNPQDARAAGALGITLQAWEQWDAAHLAYQRAQVLAPASADWRHLDGLVLQRLARPAEAAAAFRQALELAPTLLSAQARMAEALFDAGDLEASGRAYEELAREQAAAPVGELGLGRIAARQGRHADAVTHFKRAIDLFPEFGEAYYGLAQSLRALGRRDEARAALEQHRAYGTRWPAIDDPLAARVSSVRDDPRAHLTRGLRLAEAGDVAGAIEAHEAALARNPSLAQAHANLISLYGRVQQWAKAEEHYKAVLALGYNLDEAHYNYGVLLGQQQRWSEAGAAYRLAVAANPLHAQAHNNLGQLLEGDRKWDEALDQYRQAVAANPQFRLARYNLGRMLLAARRYDDAIAEFERLREPQDAEAPRYWYGLAVAHVQAGQRDEGLALAREARRLAEAFGQHELTAAIDRDMASLK
jgi:protein O-GlcNAc transferase